MKRITLSSLIYESQLNTAAVPSIGSVDENNLRGIGVGRMAHTCHTPLLTGSKMAHPLPRLHLTTNQRLENLIANYHLANFNKKYLLLAH
uniref:Uncharacterized protein n=1 Tax=Timema cristinae TaxID=61476 RepID=A0A7R9CTU0_TIMCR|nr:unnamed protein product [Timema cristinae]